MPQFTVDNAAVSAKSSHYPGRRYRQAAPIRQAIEMQKALHEATLMLKTDVESCVDLKTRAQLASAMASAAKGWQSMQDQLRIMKGKPLPGTLKPEPKRKKITRESAMTFKESLSPQQPSPPPDPIDPCI